MYHKYSSGFRINCRSRQVHLPTRSSDKNGVCVTGIDECHFFSDSAEFWKLNEICESVDSHWQELTDSNNVTAFTVKVRFLGGFEEEC